MAISFNHSNQMYTQIYFMKDRQLSHSFTWETDCMIYHNLLYVYEGEGLFTVNNKTYPVPKNSLIYFPPYCHQKISTTKKNNLSYYSVNFTAVEINNETNRAADCKLSDVTFDYPFSLTINKPYIQNEFIKTFSKLNRIFQINRSSNQYIFDESNYIKQLIAITDNALTTYFPAHKVKIIEPVLSYIDSHYKEDITLDSLSDISGISKPYLHKLFKAYTNMSPINFLINTRISKAKEFLEIGYSISETANLTGFSDISYFSKCFKSREGISPTDFKNTFSV